MFGNPPPSQNPQFNVAYLNKINSNEVAIQTNLDYQSEEHRREINPFQVFPINGYTTGVNNVAYGTASGGAISHGKTSMSVGGTASFWKFQLPNGYTGGASNIKVKLWIRHQGAGAEVIDYRIIVYCLKEGENHTTEKDTTAQWAVTADIWYLKEITVASDQFEAGDMVSINFRMEDNGNAVNVLCAAIFLDVEVDDRE